MDKTVLFLVADCPGFFIDTIYEMAKLLGTSGHRSIFAVTTPYYEQFRKVSLEEVGHVHYLSRFQHAAQENTFDDITLEDYWATYPTFVRTRYRLGKHANQWHEYRSVVAFFKKLFDEETIDLVVSEPASNSFLYFAYREAYRNNIPFLGYMSGRLPNCFNVFFDEFATKMMENPSPLQKENLQSTQPDYMSNPWNSLAKQHLFVESPIDLLKKLVNAWLNIDRSRSIEMGNPTWWQVKSHLDVFGRKLQFFMAEQVHAFQQEFDGDPSQSINIIYPLQFRPEASTSVLAREYESDVEVIRNIAFSLSDGAILYVKEHASAIGIRTVAFYREILSYPNVRLLHPDFSLKENMDHFDAVVTLTSTVGFDAIQKGIPTYVLGRVFYEDFPGVQRVESFRSLHSHLRTLKKNRATPVEEVLARYLRYSFLGTFNYLDTSILQQDNLYQLSVPIIMYLAKSND